MVTKDLIVVGSHGFSKEVAWAAKAAGWNVIGYLDDTEGNNGLDYLGLVADWQQYSDMSFIVAFGNPIIRRRVVAEMQSTGKPKFATIVHPSAQMSGSVFIGQGSVVTAGCTLTTDIQIGEHCIININSTVGHDTTLEAFVTVSPLVAVSGNVHIKYGAEIGTGSAIRQGINVGCNAIVGMGSVVVKDVPENTTVFGNPASIPNK